MYGKLFGALYEGSMVGAGSHVFAVMGYVIAKQVPDRVVGSQVRLNPSLLAAILGDSVERMEQAVQYLCEPDPQSSSPDHEGRRLVRLGQFDYQVVNGAKYRAIRDEEQRRDSNRDAKRRQRAKPAKKRAANGTANERLFEQKVNAGDIAGAEAVASAGLPQAS